MRAKETSGWDKRQANPFSFRFLSRHVPLLSTYLPNIHGYRFEEMKRARDGHWQM